MPVLFAGVMGDAIFSHNSKLLSCLAASGEIAHPPKPDASAISEATLFIFPSIFLKIEPSMSDDADDPVPLLQPLVALRPIWIERL